MFHCCFCLYQRLTVCAMLFLVVVNRVHVGFLSFDDVSRISAVG